MTFRRRCFVFLARTAGLVVRSSNVGCRCGRWQCGRGHIAALDAITEKYHHHGEDVKIVGLNDAGILMRERFGGKLGAGP